MFQTLVERLLAKILGQYIQNFSKENLSIGIWSGQVILKNIALKKDIIKKLNLPLYIKFSKLGLLKLNIPWKSLTSSKIEVLLEGLEIVIGELPQSKWDCKNTKIIEERKKEIQDFCDSVISDFAKKAEQVKQSEEGYFSKLVVKILDNLQVTIKDIHVRYEDDISKEYSFGVTLQELKLYTVNNQGKPEYVDRTKPQYANQPLRKRLELYNIGIYWNQKSQFYDANNYSERLHSSIAKRGQTKYEHNYIVLMTSQAKLLQRDPGKQFSQPEIDLEINLQTLKLEITNNQLQQIITLGERLQKYSREVKRNNTKELNGQEKKKKREQFMKIFPDYFEDWGKQLCKESMKTLEDILQIMQVEHFQKQISKYLQDKEKAKIVKQKMQKSRGWFSKPKELTSQQMEDIQKYLNNNFGQEVSVVKRPKDYYHIQISFRLQKLEVIIANTLSIIRQGIKTSFDDLKVIFKLREGGYQLVLGLQDLAINMFKQVGINPIEYTSILYKIVPFNSKITQHQYVKMQVTGNPLDKPHLNTDIKLVTSELMVVFYPKVIQVAVSFADLRVSKENKEAAIEKYGQIKEKTTVAVAESIQQPVKQLIGADLFINSITIAVPFNPKQPAVDCWGLSLGSLHFYTDDQTLKRKEVKVDEPIDVYSLQLKAFSFRQYSNIEELQNFRLKVIKSIDPRKAVINNLDFQIGLQLYNRNTEVIPKLKVRALLPDFSVTLNETLYKGLLKMGDCFEMAQGQQRISQRYTEKVEIRDKASKIGMVYIKDSMTQVWKKYVAIMSENYIYLYLGTKDQNYYAYYYIKNAQLQKIHDPSDKQKPYHFRIKNNLNEVTFGFDKPQLIEDWIIKIKKVSKKEELSGQMGVVEGSVKVSDKVSPNVLNVMVQAKIEKIELKVFVTDSLQENIINFEMAGIYSQIFLHQSKKIINMQLNRLQLSDCLKRYKNKQLQYFLKTECSKESDSLIQINILQLDKMHPQFCNVLSNINVNFGTLICNYKCETVKALMGFFIPPKEEEIKQVPEVQHIETAVVDSIMSFLQAEELFSLKLNLNISNISVTLINQKTNIQLGKLGIKALKLYNGSSNKRMVLEGSLKELYMIDYSRYPNTIIEELQSYDDFQRKIMKVNTDKEEKNMIEFNIEILNKANRDNKKMLIDTKINNMSLYYTQQPILRLITYLNTQMLPSLETGEAQKKKEAAEAAKDTKPQPSPMALKVDLDNISIFIEPDPLDKRVEEYLQLNMKQITVRNSVFYRDYIQSGQKIILVENYNIVLQQMCIYARYFDNTNRKHDYQLTNKLTFTTSVDLIANPKYYLKEFGDKFKNGLRMECNMTPFLMRINQRDYSFMMRCLNWAISHDDGVETVLYDIPNQPPLEQTVDIQKQQKDPFLMVLTIDCLSLLVMNKGIPVSFLVLDNLKYNFALKNDMSMELRLWNLYGTAIEHNKDYQILTERGMFNAIGYKKEHSFKNKLKIQEFLQMFRRESDPKEIEKTSPFMTFSMTTSQTVSFMSINVSHILMDLDVKAVMTLSTIANADEDYIRGPKAIIEKMPELTLAQRQSMKMKEEGQQVKVPPAISKRSMMSVNVGQIVASVSDSRKQKVVVFEGQIQFSTTNHGDKKIKQLQDYFRNPHERLGHSSMTVIMKNLSLYFCKIKQGSLTNKREILKPFNINFDLQSYYECKQKFYINTTDIQANTDEILFFASMVDLLNIDVIIKDSMLALKEVEKEAEQRKVKKTDSVKIEQKINKIEKEIAQAIQTKMKVKGEIKPIQFELVNDFNNNFMPVLRFMIQDIVPLVDQFLIKNHTMVSSLISLYFFNPRSSQWEPIIEPFKSTIDYLILTTPDGPNVKFLVESHKIKEDENEVGSLKINVSTQMIETLLAAKEIAEYEKKKLENKAVMVLDFIMNQDKHQDKANVQVSPFILENITNESIFVQRKDKQFQLSPHFKGPVKLDDDREIKFKLKGKSYQFGMDHYGTLKIGGSSYLIQFDIKDLSRVIRFMSNTMIQNKLFQSIYVRRSGNTSSVPKKFQVDQYIPLDNIDSFAVSLSGNSYTREVGVKEVDKIRVLVQERKQKFTILWNQSKKVSKYRVYELLPPFIIHNCIPKSIEVQFIHKASTKHTKGIPGQYTHEVCASLDITQYEFRLNIQGYGWSKLFRYSEKKDDTECSIIMEDEDGGQTTINYMFVCLKTYKQFVLTLYCRKFVVNQLKDKLVCYGNNAKDQLDDKRDRYRLLGGQKKSDKQFDDKVVLVGEEVGNKIRICGVNSMFDFAVPIPVGGIGSSSARIIVDRQYGETTESVFTIISVEISLMKASPHCDVFSKKIVLKSKGIISNCTNLKLILKEQLATKFNTVLPAGKRLHSVFGLPQIKNKMNNRYFIDCEGYHGSCLFDLPEEGCTYFKLRQKLEDGAVGGKEVNCKINVQHVEGYIFYEITQIKDAELPYEVRSASEFLRANVGLQMENVGDHSNALVSKGQPFFFMREGVIAKQFELSLTIWRSDYPGHLWVNVHPDDLNYRSQHKIKILKDNKIQELLIEVYVVFNDRTKTVIVQEINDQKVQKEIQVSYMQVNLPEIIISINQNSSRIERPYQSLVVTIRRMIFIKDETDKKTKYQFRLGFMQIDQAFPHTISNPVVITPYKFQQFTKEQEPQSIFNSMIVINNSFKENTFIDEISVDFNDLVVKFSLDFLKLITDLSKEYAEIMKFQQKSYYLNKEIEKWQDIQIPHQGRKTFIKSINISPFTIDLSAQLNLKKLGGLDFQLLNTLVSAIGVVVSNIEDAPIKLSGMSISNCIDTSDGITQKIISQYKGDVINQFYKIFGSLNIIGNPMGLLRNISTGVQDLTTKPAKGFVQGPAEFGKGIVQGTGSLVAHSVGGAFNSLSKITGTVSTGLATLAFDDEFEQHRQKEKMKKPKNILQGLQKGGKAVFYGFKEGITGVFTQPYENAKKDGVLGFMKGAAKGVAGLVVKPVTGIIDFASKTTQGIKNNALMFEDKANEARMRCPRVFYTECHILKEYNQVDSNLLYALMKPANDQKFNDCTFIDCFATGQGTQFLAVLQQHIVLIDMVKRRLIWAMQIGSFEIRNMNNKKLLHIKKTKKTNFFSSDDYQLLVEEDGQRDDIIDLIERIVSEANENK